MGLAACGGDVSADDAETTISEAFSGNFDDANKNICDTEQLNASYFDDIAGVTREQPFMFHFRIGGQGF